MKYDSSLTAFAKCRCKFRGLLKVIFNELSHNAMFHAIDKYIIVAFSIMNNPYSCHPYMFIAGIYSSEFTIVSFWAPALKSLAQNGIPKKSLDMSLPCQAGWGK